MKNLISENRLKCIINETLNEYLDNIESVQDLQSSESSMQFVYHLTWKKTCASIFKYGFSREFTASKAGNLYGAGIYSTYNLKATQDNLANHGSWEYGDTIIKLGIKSYDRFFIMNKSIAMQTYGKNFHPINQLEMLLKDRQDILQKLKSSHYWKDIVNTNTHRTSYNCICLLEALGGSGNRSDSILNELDIRGFVFHGNRDGDVAVIRDFKAAVPLAYSEDGGRTWKKDLVSQDTIDNVVKDYDPIIFLGKDTKNYIKPETYRFINGYMRVQRKSDKKYNLIDKQHNLLSPYWFDSLSSMDEKGFATCIYEGEPYKIDSTYIYDMDGDIVGELNGE